MPININNTAYTDYAEQISKNKEDIADIKGEISGLVISTTKTKVLTTGTFTTSGHILQVVVVGSDGVIPVYVSGDTIAVEGFTTTETSSNSVTVSDTSVTVTGVTAIIYYDDVTE